MIAEPNQTVTKDVEDSNPLTQEELYQLTLYKWRYSLEAYGFDAHEVKDLMFLKWLHASRRVQP